MADVEWVVFHEVPLGVVRAPSHDVALKKAHVMFGAKFTRVQSKTSYSAGTPVVPWAERDKG